MVRRQYGHYISNIGDNDIEYIPDNSFSGNKKLRLLRLKNNPIKSVEKNAFRGLPNLNDLSYALLLL
ncbi:hypothetical protein KUTeg_023502 [Tegillarca granosa]|uniref:Uncharacterized protein n=1 Tax=Tegillarca granosa TaxID=220873 RepID=A0ABQ9E7B3_TEGGR|nr:hypothetical protein KUTeg_023502 [Tegillarca granosa]